MYISGYFFFKQVKNPLFQNGVSEGTVHCELLFFLVLLGKCSSEPSRMQGNEECLLLYEGASVWVWIQALSLGAAASMQQGQAGLLLYCNSSLQFTCQCLCSLPCSVLLGF